MIDIYLHEYLKAEPNLTLYNIPQKYRVALNKKLYYLISDYETFWHRCKKQVLDEIVEKIKSRIDQNENFAFALAPSKTKLFVDDIENVISKSFPNGINLTDCFAKTVDTNMFTTNIVLTDEELKKIFSLNEKCYELKMNQDVKKLLLVDDVFALGNTFRGMRNAIKNIDDTKEIITAVILKTS
jgi:hypothetical protein